MKKDVLPIGLHKLSAVDSYHRSEGGWDEYDGYYVVIDNVVYAFEKDPCDGYRSYGDVQVVDIPLETIKNHFPPQDVFITYKEQCKYDYEDKRYYSIMDAHTGKVVLEIGTDFTDSYYPIAIFFYSPQNMAINNKEIIDCPKSENKIIDNVKSELDYVYNTMTEDLLEWVSNNTGMCVEYTITPSNVEYHYNF